MDLNAYYEKWDRISKSLDEGDDTPVIRSPSDLKKLQFGVGKALTEEEFKAQRGNTKVVASTQRLC